MRKNILIFILVLLLILGIGLGFLLFDSSKPIEPDKPVNTVDTDINYGVSLSGGYLGNDPHKQVHPKAPEKTWIEGIEIPEYSGHPYITINNGDPFFETEGLSAEPWELYYDLDGLGRVTLAEGVVGKETMPTEKRGNISSVKPTGWHTSRYPQELVDGESLYNRCHLIAFGMAGETANEYNLLTGTRYFNKDGINDQENMIIDYIRETGNHVRYRVTPVFTGDNLICDGQFTEAWSIEDEGDGICFCIWSYNVQPGIEIDYLTGDNWLSGELPPEKPTVSNPSSSFDDSLLLDSDIEGSFLLNTSKKKIHTTDCEGAKNMSAKNRSDYYGSYNALILEGYTPDKECAPWE